MRFLFDESSDLYTHISAIESFETCTRLKEAVQEKKLINLCSNVLRSEGRATFLHAPVGVIEAEKVDKRISYLLFSSRKSTHIVNYSFNTDDVRRDAALSFVIRI